MVWHDYIFLKVAQPGRQTWDLLVYIYYLSSAWFLPGFCDPCHHNVLAKRHLIPIWANFFVSISLPQTSTRWVRSPFSSRYPLSSNQRHRLTLATSRIFQKKILRKAKNRIWGHWVQSKNAIHCAMQTTPTPFEQSLFDQKCEHPPFPLSS